MANRIAPGLPDRVLVHPGDGRCEVDSVLRQSSDGTASRPTASVVLIEVHVHCIVRPAPRREVDGDRFEKVPAGVRTRGEGLDIVGISQALPTRSRSRKVAHQDVLGCRWPGQRCDRCDHRHCGRRRTRALPLTPQRVRHPKSIRRPRRASQRQRSVARDPTDMGPTVRRRAAWPPAPHPFRPCFAHDAPSGRSGFRDSPATLSCCRRSPLDVRAGFQVSRVSPAAPPAWLGRSCCHDCLHLPLPLVVHVRRWRMPRSWLVSSVPPRSRPGVAVLDRVR